MPSQIEGCQGICLEALVRPRYHPKTFQQSSSRISSTVLTNHTTSFVRILEKFTTKLHSTKFTNRKNNLLMQQSKTALSLVKKYRIRCILSLSRKFTKRKRFKKWTRKTSSTIWTKRLWDKRRYRPQFKEGFKMSKNQSSSEVSHWIDTGLEKKWLH